MVSRRVYHYPIPGTSGKRERERDKSLAVEMWKDRSGQNQTQQRMKKEGINEAKERKGENCKQEMSKAKGEKKDGGRTWGMARNG